MFFLCEELFIEQFWLVIFPEGTRFDVGKPKVIKESQDFARSSGEFVCYFMKIWLLFSRPFWERRAIAPARAGTASQHWEVRLIVHLFVKNQLLFTIAPGINNHGLEQLTSVTRFDEQNME